MLANTSLAKQIRHYAYQQLRGQLLALANDQLFGPYYANSGATKGRTLLMCVLLDKATHYYDLTRALGDIVGLDVNVFDREMTIAVTRFCTQLIVDNTAPRYVYRRAQQFLHKVIATTPNQRPAHELSVVVNHELYQANLHLLRLHLQTNVLAPVRVVWNLL